MHITNTHIWIIRIFTLNFKTFIAAPNAVKDVLVVLVNFLAYFEAEEGKKEEIELEILNLKQKTIQLEKRLLEEEKHLGKCRQVWAKKTY